MYFIWCWIRGRTDFSTALNKNEYDSTYCKMFVVAVARIRTLSELLHIETMLLVRSLQNENSEVEKKCINSFRLWVTVIIFIRLASTAARMCVSVSRVKDISLSQLLACLLSLPSLPSVSCLLLVHYIPAQANLLISSLHPVLCQISLNKWWWLLNNGIEYEIA